MCDEDDETQRMTAASIRVNGTRLVEDIKRERDYWLGYVDCCRSDYGGELPTEIPEHVLAARAKADALKWVLGEMEDIRG